MNVDLMVVDQDHAGFLLNVTPGCGHVAMLPVLSAVRSVPLVA